MDYGTLPGSIKSGPPTPLWSCAGARRGPRREETAGGRARPGTQARIKRGMRSDGRITAVDIHAIGDGGPYGRSGDHMNVGGIGSLCYTPKPMRQRGTGVWTNTPPRGAQRAPGGTVRCGP